MYNIALLDESFRKFYKSIKNAPQESIFPVNLALLHQIGLLRYHTPDPHPPQFTRYFQVLETSEKITLVNDQFIIWIVPEKENEIAYTYTLIALNHIEGPQLELTFITSGVYNTSKLVLRVLEKFLYDIQENESYLNKIKQA